MSNALYLCYFGLHEALVQTQVLPYIREIIKDKNIRMSLITFEPEFGKRWPREKIETERKKLADEGIEWHVLGYHKWPSVPATFYDIFRGILLTRWLIKKNDLKLVHARVHVPMVMAAVARKLSGRKNVKLLFDIRGFFPEEYTDAGIWKENGRLYRGVKRVEKWLMKESDGFVVLTEKARSILFPESLTTGADKLDRPVEVIPCCIDLDRFVSANTDSRTKIRQQLGIQDRFVIEYVGSFGGWYLSEHMIDLFEVALKKDPKNFILILTQRDADKVTQKMKERGFGENDFFVGSVTPDEIPAYLSAADAAVSFIKKCYSKQASSPTKIPEYLAAGLPVISNPGVGDVDEHLTTDGVGVLTGDFTAESYLQALNEIDELIKGGNIAARCRASAETRFELESVGGAKYRSIYRKLLTK